jgi:hypothetical protein
MRARPSLLLSLFSLTFVALPASAQFQKNQYQLQRDAAARYVPAPLVAERKATGAVRVLRLRFHADADYRAGGVNWQERMRAQLMQLNDVLEPAFAVRLEAAGFQRWERSSGGGALTPMLEELTQRDPGRDVDWVVGLVSPLPLVAMSFHDLGMAQVLGRHFVIRGMSSYAEMQQLQEVFGALDQDQREKLYGQRKAHKEMSVFLHEWAHTLGAMHVEQPTRIMSPGYSFRTTNFSPLEADLLAASLQARVAAQTEPDRIDWAPLRQFLLDHPAPDWRADERQHLLSLTEPGRRPAPPGAASAGAPPAKPALGAPTVVTPAAAPAAAAPPAPGVPPEIARLLDQGAVSQAAQAAAQVPAGLGRTVASRAVKAARQTLGLPAAGRFRIAPEAEPAYATTVREARRAVEAGPPEAAAAAISAGLARFPGAPGLLLLSCQLGLRTGPPEGAAKAARRCSEALAAMPDLAAAHRLLGESKLAAGQSEAALVSLRRALDLGGADAALWEELAQVHRNLGRQREFYKLLAEHEATNAGDPPAASPAP